ncbi:hypothetical protein HCG49_17020 [Arenibacter sp. 6A1]|uniref:hypothetical protein n=1 Tax=Arenibacter sp. 6A1 TaxID=2720391 RepID=UPI0014481972|nr:hypothetical protein [Arenibacter sp. 6A1]NKI28258.1 hypothetical protein [Arenibacter sp. 6A1]
MTITDNNFWFEEVTEVAQETLELLKNSNSSIRFKNETIITFKGLDRVDTGRGLNFQLLDE